MSDPYVEGLGAYLTAVQNNPRKPGEPAEKYAARIAGVVAAGRPVESREPGEEG